MWWGCCRWPTGPARSPGCSCSPPLPCLPHPLKEDLKLYTASLRTIPDQTRPVQILIPSVTLQMFIWLIKGSHHLKKSGVLWKLFIKWWPAPPHVLLLWNPYFDFSLSLFRVLTFLNKRYEIRLTPPPRLWKSFIKFRFFLNDGFPNISLFSAYTYIHKLMFVIFF